MLRKRWVQWVLVCVAALLAGALVLGAVRAGGNAWRTQTDADKAVSAGMARVGYK